MTWKEERLCSRAFSQVASIVHTLGLSLNELCTPYLARRQMGWAGCDSSRAWLQHGRYESDTILHSVYLNG